MTTLDEYARFLTARWDEQERDARVRQVDAMTGSRWKGYPEAAYDEIQSFTLAETRRTLDDLAAKRAVLERIGFLFDEPDGLGNLVEDVLAFLAAPFRDHPDHPAKGG